jgi:dienelactone hydrolase
MKGFWLPTGLALLVLLPQAKAEDKIDADLEAAARALFKALTKEDFQAAGKDFDATMQKALPADKLGTTWKDLLKQFGTFLKQTDVRQQQAGKYQIIILTCQFEKAPLDVRVVFDGDKKVAGLFFVPSKPPEYKPPAYVKRDAFTETEVKIGSGDWVLPGTLTLPKGDGPFPAVVLVHGSGPHDRDETIGPNRVLRDLAWGLASRGIAVLRYEKRTKEHAGRMAKLKDLTVKEEVLDDALAAVRLLQKTDKIDPKKVFVLGHSLGAMLAPKIGELEASLAGLILLAAPSRPLEDLIVEQHAYLFDSEGGLTAEHKDELNKLKAQAARVKDAKLTADTPAAELPLDIPASYWLSLRDADPTKIAVKLKLPLLLLQGERDYQVTMTDFAGWKKLLGERRNCELRSYPKLNHLFIEGSGKSKPDEYFREGHVAGEVIDDIAAWLKKQGK